MKTTSPIRLSTAAIMLGLLPWTAGCGAIFNGTRQNITATSAPDGAMIRVDPGNAEYTTPASLNLERKNNYVLTFEKEGYTSAKFEIQKGMQAGILILDILFTGLIGVIVDAATGAWFKLSPETAVVALTNVGADGPDVIEVSVEREGNTLHFKATTSGVQVKIDSTER